MDDAYLPDDLASERFGDFGGDSDYRRERRQFQKELLYEREVEATLTQERVLNLAHRVKDLEMVQRMAWDLVRLVRPETAGLVADIYRAHLDADDLLDTRDLVRALLQQSKR